MTAPKLTTAKFDPAIRRAIRRAGTNSSREHVKYLFAFLVFCFLQFGPPLSRAAIAADDPRVSGITVRKLTTSDDKKNVTLALQIKGDYFRENTKVEVNLVNLETGVVTTAVVVSPHDENLINATVILPIEKKAVKYQFRILVDKKPAIPPGHVGDYTLDVGKEEKKETVPSPFEITYETFKSEEYPNLHSILITNKNQNNQPGFSSNPSLMKVDILPPGATNVTVQPGSSPYQMLVTFLAAEKFEVKGVVVTVFDPDSLLADRQPRAFSTPFKEKEPKATPNQPKINDIQVLSMQRHSGYGLVRISGDGFGDYERPPITGEKELLCCLNRSRNPDISDEQEDRRTVSETEKKRREARNPPSSQDEAFNQNDIEVCQLAKPECGNMAAWRRRIEDRVNVTLMPRNPDFRIERTQVVYIDDKIIDVYFEFSRWDNYSVPLRLENATVTINKGAVKDSRTTDEAGAIAAVLSSPQTFVATKDVGASRDKNLEYKYVVLNQKDASQLFGSGVGDNFFAIELTVINNGKKKVAVPLGSIQAEASWYYGYGKDNDFYDEGPSTLPSLPLAAVAGYFDAYQKTKGRRAKLFNFLEGLGTLAATMVPIIHEVQRPGSILVSGFVPALKKSLGDLSSEQLQRLTSMSWENVEEIVPGGSKSKFVYIPRADQLFGNADRRAEKGHIVRTRKHVINLVGVEVAGFEVTESEKKLATEQPKEASATPPPQ